MSNQTLSLINVGNYSLRAGFSCVAYKGAGVCIFLRKDIIYSSTDVSRYCDENNIHLCAAELKVLQPLNLLREILINL
jgi:hypothetical protein